jgi:hypothetical protein
MLAPTAEGLLAEALADFSRELDLCDTPRWLSRHDAENPRDDAPRDEVGGQIASESGV